MTNSFLILLGFGFAALAFIYWRLRRTNMDVPPNAEKALGRLGTLHFCLDNGIPIKTPMG
jgi:hypothetical protein